MTNCKIFYFSILFILILELLVFYFNLIILKSKITFYKVGFIICLYSFNEVGFLMCFLSFQVKHWLMAMNQALFVFFKLRVKMKKYQEYLYTFHMLVKSHVKECRVYFFTFLDSLKVDYEKGNSLRSYI